jgi:phosphatase NudJ
MDIQTLSSAPQTNGRYAPRVSVATIVCLNNQFLMVEEWIQTQLKLNQPAGHLEANETLIEAAARETLEETGCRIRITHLLCVDQLFTQDADFVRFTFVGELIEQLANYRLDEGIERALWLSESEVRARVEQHRSSLVQSSLDAFNSGVRIELSTLGVAYKR